MLTRVALTWPSLVHRRFSIFLCWHSFKVVEIRLERSEPSVEFPVSLFWINTSDFNFNRTSNSVLFLHFWTQELRQVYQNRSIEELVIIHFWKVQLKQVFIFWTQSTCIIDTLQNLKISWLLKQIQLLFCDLWFVFCAVLKVSNSTIWRRIWRVFCEKSQLSRSQCVLYVTQAFAPHSLNSHLRYTPKLRRPESFK